MRYESLLASRYIKAQKRQSVFTCMSIIAAVAVITMVFILYSVCMNCLENTFYSEAPYHLVFSELTEEKGEAMADFGEVRSVKLSRTPDGVSAYVLFGSDIGDREIWLQKAAQKIGASEQYERSKYSSMHGAYEWNDKLMKMDGVYDGAHLFKLRIFCIFFIFAVLIAFALRLIIDTAFEVSSKERERHYGVLQSIGATPEQIVRIITYEGMRLCAVGVPFGLIAGIGFAYLMYHVLLRAGLADLFQGMTAAKLSLPFSVDPKMLLVAAAVGIVWVFLSAYGVGMRIIKKMPMEAIITRADKVEKVRRHTLSGLLFGISGSIASRNTRRQKKRFAITVLTLTVSITMFALFSTLTETVERSVNGYIKAEMLLFNGGSDDIDYGIDLGNPLKGISLAEAEKTLRDSGLFENIAIEWEGNFLISEHADDDENAGGVKAAYLNREAYTRLFGADAAVSYDELVSSGGYVSNPDCGDYAKYAEQLQSGSLTAFSLYTRLPEDAEIENMSYGSLMRAAESERREHTLDIIGSVSAKNKGYLLIGAMETYEKIYAEWFGAFNDHTWVYCNYAGSSADNYQYNAADYKKAQDWFGSHQDINFMAEINPESPDSWYDDYYGIKWKTHSILATVRAGVLMLNLLIALAALVNLMNIISTGIANRRSELASLQCVGMTDKQLDRMAIIECLQFAGAAAVISAVICAVVMIGAKFGLTALINASFVDESKETREMLLDIVRLDHITPFLRIALASLTAFGAGCVTSLLMLRAQNSESLSDQIRGSEMKLDTKKSHILRNSILAVAGAFVLTIAGLRIYSISAYARDRSEYAKAGYLNLVDSNGFKMNVYSTGAEHGKHTIVGLAGMAVNSYPIVTAELNARLGKENTLVYPDRAGYGFSDDSYKSQSLEQVVEDYRTGLKNAGFEAPYVLMGHSYGDYYALWWQIHYPDEVEAMIFLDGTWLAKNEFWDSSEIDEFPSESAAYAAARRSFLRSWLGLDRLFPAEAQTECRYGKSLFSEEQLALWDRTDYPEWSAALLSELANEPEAARELRQILHPTDTPKLYFSTMYTSEEDVREFMEFQKADYEASGLEYKLNIETAAKAEWNHDAWEYQDIYEKYLTPFLEQCGNYRLVSIGGDHGLFFAQKPDEVADTILDFLAETTE